MAGRWAQRRRGIRPEPIRLGGRRRFWLCCSLGLLVVALLVIAWQRQAGSPKTGDLRARSESGPATPLLRLECPGLGIGSDQGATALVLDTTGIIRRPSEIAAAALPPFVFAPVQGIVIGQQGPPPVFGSAAEVARRWQTDWAERLGPVTGITAQGGCGVTVETAEGVTVEFLAENLERQFRNLTWIWRHTQEEGREIATVNLIPERNVPVTFR